MSRHFRPWTIDQTQLLPAAVVDYVPADHLAQFVVALAREHLDLSEIVASYKSGLGHSRASWFRRDPSSAAVRAGCDQAPESGSFRRPKGPWRVRADRHRARRRRAICRRSGGRWTA